MAYFGLGTKATIMANLAALIKPGITGVVFVDYQRDYDTGSGPEKTPGAFINDLYEEKNRLLKDLAKNTLQVGIVCWVRAEEGESLWTKLNTFVLAIQGKIVADPNLSSQAYYAKVTRIATDDGSRHPVGLAVIAVEISYFSAI
jgi:hypothetical protein